MKTWDNATVRAILSKGSYLTQKDLDAGEKTAIETRAGLLEALLNQGALTRELWGQAVAESLSVPFIDLARYALSREQLQVIPEKIARAYRVVLAKSAPKTVLLASDDPLQQGLGDAVLQFFSKRITIGFALPEDIDSALDRYRADVKNAFAECLKNTRGAPELLAELFSESRAARASDIHFEPHEDGISIRFRIDGVLQDVALIEKERYDTILNRIKVQAKLPTDAHFSALDGSLRHDADGGRINARVSIIPTLDGEKTVLRLLAEYVRGLTLDDLGLSQKHQHTLLESAQKPFGMILVVGPTGSGKTTTLYSLLKRIKSPGTNITTIEDPVEYKIPGVNHIQVNPQTNLTFVKGLRSLVRQDPDVIFLGEIRDAESAEIGVNAALTGHLLLSTFHANDAATAIPRLLDMGIERFLLASTLELVIAQTLVRRICESCRQSFDASDPRTKKLFKKTRLYRGKGCVQCNQTGYRGRIALYEFVNNSPELSDVILSNPSKPAIRAIAAKNGSRSLFEDGLDKVAAGLTTLDEVFRVAAPW